MRCLSRCAARAAATGVFVARAGLDLLGTSTGMAVPSVAVLRDGVENRLDNLRVVPGGRAPSNRQWHARRVDDRMAHGAGPCAVSWVRAKLLASFGRYAAGIDACLTPVDAIGLGQASQQLDVQSIPHAGALSVAQPASALLAAAHPKAQRHPRDAEFEPELYPRRGDPVVNERTAALRIRAIGQQHRFQDRPQMLVNQLLRALMQTGALPGLKERSIS